MRQKIFLAAMSFLVLGPVSSAQTVSVSLSSGLFFPKERLYRDIYGQSRPSALEFRISINRNFGLAAGIEYLSDKGTALNIRQGDDEFPVRFRMISYPVSACFLYPLGKIAISAAAGISFHSYQEEWEDLDQPHKGNKTKPFLSGGIEYHIAPRLAVRLLLRYENILTERGPLVDREINLGGFSLLGGLSVSVL